MRHESHIEIDGEKLLAQLSRRGMSAAQLARVSGISAGTLTSIIGHGKPVTPRTARKIAAALAATPVIDGLENLLVA
ncbi:MAG: helix-turn-helix domain-containing protein [Candidatus Dormibacteraceae bacterium]